MYFLILPLSLLCMQVISLSSRCIPTHSSPSVVRHAAWCPRSFDGQLYQCERGSCGAAGQVCAEQTATHRAVLWHAHREDTGTLPSQTLWRLIIALSGLTFPVWTQHMIFVWLVYNHVMYVCMSLMCQINALPPPSTCMVICMCKIHCGSIVSCCLRHTLILTFWCCSWNSDLSEQIMMGTSQSIHKLRVIWHRLLFLCTLLFYCDLIHRAVNWQFVVMAQPNLYYFTILYSVAFYSCALHCSLSCVCVLVCIEELKVIVVGLRRKIWQTLSSRTRALSSSHSGLWNSRAMLKMSLKCSSGCFKSAITCVKLQHDHRLGRGNIQHTSFGLLLCPPRLRGEPIEIVVPVVMEMLKRVHGKFTLHYGLILPPIVSEVRAHPMQMFRLYEWKHEHCWCLQNQAWMIFLK